MYNDDINSREDALMAGFHLIDSTNLITDARRESTTPEIVAIKTSGRVQSILVRTWARRSDPRDNPSSMRNTIKTTVTNKPKNIL